MTPNSNGRTRSAAAPALQLRAPVLLGLLVLLALLTSAMCGALAHA